MLGWLLCALCWYGDFEVLILFARVFVVRLLLFGDMVVVVSLELFCCLIGVWMGTGPTGFSGVVCV